MLLLCSAYSESASVGSRCSPLSAGDACLPNTHDVTVLSNATPAQCIGACEAQNKNGCCWHSPKDGECQFNAGGTTGYYGGTDVRSASDCTVPPAAMPSPEQMHVAYGTSDGSMVIAWASLAYPAAGTPMLYFQPEANDGGEIQRTAVVANSTQGGNTSPHVSVHHATLTGLDPGGRYSYSVGWAETPELNTAPRTFRTKPAGVDWSPRLAVFGDLGWTNNQILPFLRDESVAETIDAILLYGDMTYWWDTAAPGTPGHGDHFFRDVSTMSNGAIPFHVSAGNGDSGVELMMLLIEFLSVFSC